MILVGNGLKKVFNRRTVFQNISFEVHSGQVLSITGTEWKRKIYCLQDYMRVDFADRR